MGLAPTTHGAYRTGRPLWGDSSGRALFRALTAHGFAENPTAPLLKSARITNAVRCAPPDNRPTLAEVRACNAYLCHDLAMLWTPHTVRERCVVALGSAAYEAVGAALGVDLPPFASGAEFQAKERLTVFASHHPSGRNLRGRRPSQDMLDRVFARCRELIG